MVLIAAAKKASADLSSTVAGLIAAAQVRNVHAWESYCLSVVPELLSLPVGLGNQVLCAGLPRRGSMRLERPGMHLCLQ